MSQPDGRSSPPGRPARLGPTWWRPPGSVVPRDRRPGSADHPRRRRDRQRPRRRAHPRGRRLHRGQRPGEGRHDPHRHGSGRGALRRHGPGHRGVGRLGRQHDLGHRQLRRSRPPTSAGCSTTSSARSSPTTSARPASSSGAAPATDGPPTGRCLIVVTPDAQRTMNTYLGSSEFFGPEHVDGELIAERAGHLPRGLPLRPARGQGGATGRPAASAHDAGRRVASRSRTRSASSATGPSGATSSPTRSTSSSPTRHEALALYEVDTFDEALAAAQRRRRGRHHHPRAPPAPSWPAATRSR